MRLSTRVACLRPKCTAPRLLTPEDSHAHRNCTNWLVSASFEEEYETMGSLTHHLFPSVCFEELGVKAVPIMLLIKDWPDNVGSVFEELQGRLRGEIQLIKNQKLKEFESYIKLNQEAYKEIRNISHNLDNPDYNESKLMKQIPNFLALQQLKAFNFLQIPKTTHYFDKNILPALKQTCQLIQSVGPLYDQANLQAMVQMKKKLSQFEEQLRNSGSPINENLQKVVNMFGVELPKVTFQRDIVLYRISCWVCDAEFFAKKSDGPKAFCIRQLIQHILAAHQQKFRELYVKRVLKIEAEQFSFSNFVKKVNCEKITKVFVIDRENGANTIAKPDIADPSVLWIEVLNKSNRNIAKGPFIVSPSKARNSADTLIIMLVQQLCKAKVEEIILVTKDHFGCALQEVISGIFGRSLECIQPEMLESKFVKNPYP